MANVSFSQAMAAYQQQARMLENLPQDSGEDTAAATGSGSFADTLSKVAADTVSSQYKAEHLQLQALSGKAELSDLVTAVTNAELSLDTIVAVRDKVISAYQSIISMPI